MKKYLKKLLVGLLVTAMSVTNINYVPVAAEPEDPELTVYLDYSGKDNLPFFTFSSEIDGKDVAFSPWDNSYAYALDEVGEGWYSFTAKASVFNSGLELVSGTYADNKYNYGAWVSKTPYANYSAILEQYNTVYFDAAFTKFAATFDDYNGTVVETSYYVGFANDLVEDYKMTEESEGILSLKVGAVEKGSVEFGIYTDLNWTEAYKWDKYSIISDGYGKIVYDSVNGTVSYKVYEDENYENEIVIKDYYVGFANDLVEDYKMTEESEGTFSLKVGAVEKGSVEFGIYTDLNWTEAYKWAKYDIVSDGFGKIVYNPATGTVSYKVYEDAEYTTEIVVKEFYVGISGDITEANKMTEESDGIFVYKFGQVTEGGTTEFGIYPGTSWNNAAVGWKSYSHYSNGYAEAVYDSVANKVEFKIFEDSDYTIYIEDTSIAPDFFFGYRAESWPQNGGICKPMTKDEDGKYSYECGNIGLEKLGYYVCTESWSGNLFDWTYYDIPAEGYLKAFYDSAANVVTFKLYTDDTYTTEVTVKNQKVTLYVYYPGDKDVANDTLTIAFAKGAVTSSADADKLGDPYKETYWNRVCYPLTKVKDNWYSFDVYKDFGGFQIVANPHSEVYPANNYDNENTTWIIDFGYYGDVKTDDVDNVRYNDMFNGEREAVYVMYNTLFDSIEDAEAFDKSFGWDYYIAGSTGDFEPKCDPGIFSNYWAQDNYHYEEAEDRYTGDINWQDQMVKSKDGKTLTWVSSTKAKKFETYALNVYADKSWFGKVWKNNFSFLAVADAYVKVTYDLENSKFSVEYFDDIECTEPTEFDEITIYYYYGVTGAKDIYVAFNAEIPGQKIAKKYWGRNCYAMTEVGNGWYVFKGYKAIYGGYQVVVNPQNEDFAKGDKEDKEGTLWLTDIGDYGDVSTSDSDLSRFKAFLLAGNKAYIKYNKVFKTQDEADNFTDWTYYVAGSTNAYTNTDAGKGIFSNYWAGDFVKGVDDEGKEYEKKEDTWPDVLTKEKDNVYSVKLGKAVKGTTYAFNVYTEKDWNATNLTGSMGAANPSFKATSNNYVKLYFNRDLKTGKNTWSIEYYTDKECKTKAKMSAPKKLKLKKLKATKGGKIKLSWKAVDGATSYGIYADGKKIGFSKKNSKLIEYKKAGKAVKYTVVARSPQYGNSEQSKALKVTTPGKVKKFKAKGQKKGIKLSWKKAKKAKGYVVYRSTKKKKGFKKVATVKKNKFLDKKAKKGKKYYYKVYAFKKNGKIKVYSNATKAKSAKKK